ncbi:MAG: 50S ribosomal protein L31 [Oscillospiraceae bacterium]|nr:50S ribosomal protein L31 [Oscillospiraceae bacterium]
MRENLHPKYEEAVITCACGNVIKTRSTKGKISVDVCSKCHPFFTGKQKLVDAGGRVDRFRKKIQHSGLVKSCRAVVKPPCFFITHITFLQNMQRFIYKSIT